MEDTDKESDHGDREKDMPSFTGIEDDQLEHSSRLGMEKKTEKLYDGTLKYIMSHSNMRLDHGYTEKEIKVFTEIGFEHWERSEDMEKKAILSNVQQCSMNYSTVIKEMPPREDPPPYDQIFSDLKKMTIKEELKRAQDKNSDQAVFHRELLSLRSNISERFGSVEREVIESRQRNDQRHQSIDDRLERIEENLQASQIKLNEDQISERVVELLMRNEKFATRIHSEEDPMERRKVQVHDTKVPIWKASCPKPCFCVCHSQNENNNWENIRHDERSTSGRRNSCNSKISEKDVNLRNSVIDNAQLALGACGGDPGDSPSEDSSSDDNGDDEHKKRKRRLDKRTQRKSWEIDTVAWSACLEEGGNFEQQAISLLKQGKLPDQKGLKAVCSRCTISSFIVKEICNKICIYIKVKSDSIVDVWAATVCSKSASSEDIVFVLLTKDKEKVDEATFLTYQRHMSHVKKMNKEIGRKEYIDPLSPDEKDNLEKCLRENGKSLMDSHSNLTRVTASWYRANDNTERPLLRRELCIALYVQIKGYVPLGEKHFPSNIGDFPVVVREGIFTLCRGSNEYHKNVKMGCAIAGERIGTLGAFVEFENDSNLYGLTCAHVILEDNKMGTLLDKGTINFGSNSDWNVYQPATQECIQLGKTDTLLYSSGGNGQSGLEIALININQERLPTEGTFPDDSNYKDAGFGPQKPFVFYSGKICRQTELLSPIVYKYGSQSKLTQGVCRMNGTSIRTQTYVKNYQPSKLVLHDQMEIVQVNSFVPFAKQGDSGALVFTEDAQHGLSALGLFEGEMETIYFMTPIYDVLRTLHSLKGKRCRLKPFQPLDLRINDQSVNADIVSSLSENVIQLQVKLNELEQGFAQDLAQHKTEITEEMRKQHDEHKRSNQEIKLQQEKQKEELERQSAELRRQGEEYIKQSEEIKDRQEKQSEESKKQSQEIKNQNAEILALLKPSHRS